MVCPKCGAHIKRFDLSPNCKNCGVHILYYSQEKELARDAKRTELEFAKARVFVSKLKAAFIAGIAPVSRMILGVLSVAVLLCPLGRFYISVPFFETELSIGALGIYKLISDGMITLLPDFAASGIGGSAAVLAAAAEICFILAALCILALFFAWILSFTDLKKTAKAQCVIISLAIFFILVSEILVCVAFYAAPPVKAVTVYPVYWGTAVIILEFSAFLASNILFLKHIPTVTVSETDIKRIEIYKKIKAGEITYDDLSLPVFETPEEREQRENALAGTSKKAKKTRKAVEKE